MPGSHGGGRRSSRSHTERLRGVCLAEGDGGVSEHMLLGAPLVRDFTDVAKCPHRLRQGTPRSISQGGFDYSAARRRASPALMRSFMILLGRKTRTRRGVIGTSCPVLGLRPTRSPFWRMLNDP